MVLRCLILITFARLRCYSKDFKEQEKLHLRIALQHFEFDVPQHPKLKNLSSLFEL